MAARNYYCVAETSAAVWLTKRIVMSDKFQTLSHTRGVPLANLAGLCVILGEQAATLNVRMLANEAIQHGLLDFDPIAPVAFVHVSLNDVLNKS